MGRLPALLRRSLTWDQGQEITHHARFTIATGIPVFFYDPHSPRQRGTNETPRKREVPPPTACCASSSPKDTNLSMHTQTDLDNAAYLLNGRPRQTLNWLKPAEKLDTLLLDATDALTD